MKKLSSDILHYFSSICNGISVLNTAPFMPTFRAPSTFSNTHPLITIFGVVIGLSLFGFMGIIFGPLLLSIFVLCVQIFKAEYLEEPQGQKRLTGRTGGRT